MKAFLCACASFALAVVMSTAAFASDWYVTGFGGWNQNDVVSSPFVSEQSGFVVGGAVGKAIPAVPGLRIEGELAFRQNEVEIFGGFLSADHDTTTVMGNLVYDLPVDWGRVNPYVLAGVGYGHTEATFESVALLKLEASGVAWQLGLGVDVDIADGVSAGVGYRYVQAPEVSILGTGLSDGSNHAVLATMTFALN